MSDTPETDHLENELGQAARMSHPILWAQSRKLERERDEAREKYATEATEHMLAINKICNESKKAKEELANIESLMFGGLVQFTPKDGIAWRVFDAVMELKKERDEAREDATNYYAKIGELEQERDEAREVLREISEASGFDNIGNWARNKAKNALYR